MRLQSELNKFTYQALFCLPSGASDVFVSDGNYFFLFFRKVKHQPPQNEPDTFSTNKRIHTKLHTRTARETFLSHTNKFLHFLSHIQEESELKKLIIFLL